MSTLNYFIHFSYERNYFYCNSLYFHCINRQNSFYEKNNIMGRRNNFNGICLFKKFRHFAAVLGVIQLSWIHTFALLLHCFKYSFMQVIFSIIQYDTLNALMMAIVNTSNFRLTMPGICTFVIPIKVAYHYIK